MELKIPIPGTTDRKFKSFLFPERKRTVFVRYQNSKRWKQSVLAYHLSGGNKKHLSGKFQDLKNKGLKSLKMIISDNFSCLDEAIEDVFPSVRHPLYWFHLKRNIKKQDQKKDIGMKF